MRLRYQRGDIDMGGMPTQLIAGPDQISVAGPTAVWTTEHPAGRFVALMAVRTSGTRAALALSEDFKVTLRFVLNLTRLFAVFPHPVALALGLAPPGFGDARGLAQDQLRDARLLSKAHDTAGDFVVDVTHPSCGLGFQPRQAALDLAGALRAGRLARQRRLQVSLFFGAANFLRHQAATIEHETLAVFGQDRPGPALAGIARGKFGRLRRGPISEGFSAIQLHRDQDFVEEEFCFENPAGVFAHGDHDGGMAIPAAQGEMAVFPMDQVAPIGNGRKAFLGAPGISDLGQAVLAIRSGRAEIAKELAHALLNAGGGQTPVARFAFDEVRIEVALGRPWPMGPPNTLVEADHVVPQGRHRPASLVGEWRQTGRALELHPNHTTRRRNGFVFHSKDISTNVHYVQEGGAHSRTS